MTQENSGADRNPSTRCSFLLVGFDTAAVTSIAQAMTAVNWATIIADDGDDAMQRAQVAEFDFALIKTNGIDVISPVMIEAIRTPTSASRRLTIIAFADFFHPFFNGLSDFLRRGRTLGSANRQGQPDRTADNGGGHPDKPRAQHGNAPPVGHGGRHGF